VKSEIAEKIRKKRIQSTLQASRFMDLHDAGAREVVDEAKALMRGELNGEMTQEAALRAAWQSMASDYTGDKQYLIPKSRSPKSFDLWRRVEEARVASGQDAETYLRAQFDFFSKAFGKAPEVKHLATPKAIQRAKEYVGTSRAVRAPEYHMELPALLKSTDARMRALCKAQGMTRKEVYERLVKTGLVAFPKEYTSIDPAYAEVMGT